MNEIEMAKKTAVVREVVYTYFSIQAFVIKKTPLPESYDPQIAFTYFKNKSKPDHKEVIWGMLQDYLPTMPTLPIISRDDFEYCLAEVIAGGAESIREHKKGIE